MTGLSFTSVQRAAITAPGSVCIAAGAGSGKTRVLTERVLHLLARGARPDEFFLGTFSDLAAAELRSRLLQGVRERHTAEPARWAGVLREMALMQVSTIHSLCARIAREHPVESGAGLTFQILDPTEWRLWWRARRLAVLGTLPPEWLAELAPQRLHGLLDQLLEDPLRAGEAIQITQQRARGEFDLPTREEMLFAEVFGAVKSALMALKEEEGVVTFADLEQYASRALEHVQVREYYARRWKYLMVDELQDTTPLQWQILTALRGPHTVFTLVGDEKQSIYAFRGACVDVFRQAQSLVQEAGGQNLSMHTSFRSSSEVLRTLNVALPRLMTAALDADQPFDGLEAGLEWSERGEAAVELQVVTGGQGQERVTTLARALVGRAQALLGQPIHEARLHGDRPARWRDMALLLPTRTHLHLYEQVLRESGVPYVVHGGLGFLERPEVRAVIHLLRAIADPADDAVLIAALRGPYFQLPLEAIYQLGLWRQAQESLWHVLQSVDEGWARQAVSLLRRWRAMSATHSAVQVLQDAETSSGFTPVQAAQADGLRRTLNLVRLRELIASAGLEGRADLITLAQYLGQLQDVDARLGEATPAHEDALQVMTVHQAKGLEFGIVLYAEALPPGEWRSPEVRLDPQLGLLLRQKPPTPEWRQAQERERAVQTAERERLNYVACTRAAEHLVIGLSASNGRRQSQALSEYLGAFLTETPRQLHEAGGLPPLSPLTLVKDAASPVLEVRSGPTYTVPAELPVTSLRLYQQCPQAFALRYLAGWLPLAQPWFPGEKRGGHLIGDAVHRALQRGWTGRDIPRRFPHLTDAEKEDVQRLISQLCLPDLAHLQRPFEREVPVQLRMGRLTLRGVADAFDPQEKLLVDYKTESGVRPEAHLLQLAVYARALGVTRAELAYLRQGHLHVFEAEDLRRGLQLAQATVTQIERHQFQPTPSLESCGQCIFRHLCPDSAVRLER